MIPKKITQSESWSIIYCLVNLSSLGCFGVAVLTCCCISVQPDSFWKEEENLYLIHSFSLNSLFLYIVIFSYFSSGNKSFLLSKNLFGLVLE